MNINSSPLEEDYLALHRVALQRHIYIRKLEDALKAIYEDIPTRSNMTEAGRVAMMADIAGKALGYPS